MTSFDDRYRMLELLFEAMRDISPTAFEEVVSTLVNSVGADNIARYASTVVGEDADEELLRRAIAIATAKEFTEVIAHGLVVEAKWSLETGEDGMLDDAVHDVASQHASNINNSGIEEQIDFLIEQLGPEETMNLIDQAGKNTT